MPERDDDGQGERPPGVPASAALEPSLEPAPATIEPTPVDDEETESELVLTESQYSEGFMLPAFVEKYKEMGEGRIVDTWLELWRADAEQRFLLREERQNANIRGEKDWRGLWKRGQNLHVVVMFGVLILVGIIANSGSPGWAVGLGVFVFLFNTVTNVADRLRERLLPSQRASEDSTPARQPGDEAIGHNQGTNH